MKNFDVRMVDGGDCIIYFYPEYAQAFYKYFQRNYVIQFHDGVFRVGDFTGVQLFSYEVDGVHLAITISQLLAPEIIRAYMQNFEV